MIVTKDVILAAVASELGLTVAVLKSRQRSKAIARGRQAAMFLCHKHGHSNSSTARYFDVDHSTVIHAVQRIRQLLGPEDRSFVAAINRADAMFIKEVVPECPP